MAHDFDFADHGSVTILTPLSEAAREWCSEYLPGDATRWGADGYVIEPRYVAPILSGINQAGLIWED